MIKNKLIQKSVREAAVLLEHKIYLWRLKQASANSAASSRSRGGEEELLVFRLIRPIITAAGSRQLGEEL